MRQYTLASPDRDDVDLRTYKYDIVNAVHTYMPHATVRVEKDCYCVDPTPNRSEAIKIGKKICESDLKYYCIKIPKLFTSTEIGGPNGAQKPSKTHTGGHK